MAVARVLSLHGRFAGSLNSFLTSLNLSKLVLEFIDVIGPNFDGAILSFGD